jgi:hypothetical protein
VVLFWGYHHRPQCALIWSTISRDYVSGGVHIELYICICIQCPLHLHCVHVVWRPFQLCVNLHPHCRFCNTKSKATSDLVSSFVYSWVLGWRGWECAPPHPPDPIGRACIGASVCVCVCFRHLHGRPSHNVCVYLRSPYESRQWAKWVLIYWNV